MSATLGHILGDLIFNPPSRLIAFETNATAASVTAVGVVDGDLGDTTVRVYYPATRPKTILLPPLKARWLPESEGLAKSFRLVRSAFVTRLDLGPIATLISRILTWLLSLLPSVLLPGLPDTYPSAHPVAYNLARFPVLLWSPELRGFGEEHALLLAEIAASVPAIVLVVPPTGDREATGSRQKRLERVIAYLSTKLFPTASLLGRVLQTVDLSLVCLGGPGLGGATVLNFLRDNQENRLIACAVVLDGHAFAPTTDSDRYPPTLLMVSSEMQADRQAVAAIRAVPKARVLTSRNTTRIDLTELCFWTPRLIGAVLLRLLGLSHALQAEPRETYKETVRWVAAFVQANTVASASSCEDSDVQGRYYFVC